jgi:hypothetical protein
VLLGRGAAERAQREVRVLKALNEEETENVPTYVDHDVFGECWRAGVGVGLRMPPACMREPTILLP